MRQVVRELVEPTISRSHEDREVVTTLKRVLEQQETRVKELEIALFKSNETMTEFDQIRTRFAEVVRPNFHTQ